MDALDGRLIDLFATDAAASGVLEASPTARRRPRHRPGAAGQARVGRGDHRLGTRALPRGARATR